MKKHTIIITACVFIVAMALWAGFEKHKESSFVNAAKDITEAAFKEEQAAGFLADYQLLEYEYYDGDYSEYELVSRNQDWKEYNVIGLYEVNYVGGNTPMLSAVVRRFYLMEKNAQGLWEDKNSVYPAYDVTEASCDFNNPPEGACYTPKFTPFVATMDKKTAKEKNIREIAEILTEDFARELMKPSSERPFRITEYRNIHVDDMISADSFNGDIDGYYGLPPRADGTVNCWIINSGFDWKFVGAHEILGYRGAAFPGNNQWQKIFDMGNWFILAQWEDKYTMETCATFIKNHPEYLGTD